MILLNLLPCPYCAEHEKLKPVRNAQHMVKCLSCGATGPTAQSVSDAAAAWNRRPYREAIKASAAARTDEEINELFTRGTTS